MIEAHAVVIAASKMGAEQARVGAHARGCAVPCRPLTRGNRRRLVKGEVEPAVARLGCQAVETHLDRRERRCAHRGRAAKEPRECAVVAACNRSHLKFTTPEDANVVRPPLELRGGDGDCCVTADGAGGGSQAEDGGFVCVCPSGRVGGAVISVVE